jgi:hypothetical protein
MLNGQAAKHIACGWPVSASHSEAATAICYAKSSISLVEFAQQLLFQMSPRSLFDPAPLCGYAFLLRLTLSARSWFDGLRHVPDLRPARADVLLFWLCVRIHECSALPVGDKNKRNRCVSRHNFIDRRFVVNK